MNVLSRLFGSEPEEPLDVSEEAGPEIAEALREVRRREELLRERRERLARVVDEFAGQRDRWAAKTLVRDRRAEREELLLRAADGDETAEEAIERLDAEDRAARRSAEVAGAKLAQVDSQLGAARRGYDEAAHAHEEAVSELHASREWVLLYNEVSALPGRIEEAVAAVFAAEHEVAGLRRLAKSLRRSPWIYPLPGVDSLIQRLENIEGEINRRRPPVPAELPEPRTAPSGRPPLVPKGATTVFGEIRGTGTSPDVNRGDEIVDFS